MTKINMDLSKTWIAELHLTNFSGDSFTIDENITRLFVNNCPDFKTVPAHITDLNIMNCPSFKTVPKTVKKFNIYNCPLYEEENNDDRQELIFLRSHIENLEKKIKDLESQLIGNYGSENTRIRRFSTQPKD